MLRARGGSGSAPLSHGPDGPAHIFFLIDILCRVSNEMMVTIGSFSGPGRCRSHIGNRLVMGFFCFVQYMLHTCIFSVVCGMA